MHTVFEVFENSKTGIKVAQRGDVLMRKVLDDLNINIEIPLFEGDTVRNSFGDTISAALGYLLKRPKS